MKKCFRILIVFAILFINLFLTGCMADNLKIRENKPTKIQYETYNNGLFSMKIPKGWEVQIAQNTDLPHFTFMVYNPNNRDYQIFVNLKYEGFLKSQAAKNYFKRFGGMTPMANMPVLAQLSTEYYFKNTFNDVARLNSTSNFIIPTMNDFTVIQNFGKTAYGGDLLRATYVNKSGKTIEGMFTASPKEIGSYYVPANMISGPRIDTYYRNVYNTMFITTPEGEFVNWHKTLTTCLDSIQFSDSFVSGVQATQDNIMRTIKANSQTYRQISDMVMSSWEKRNVTYDVMSQKRSDATLGYERVYDTQTGEVYKAYNGFANDYKGKRFQPITNEMYSHPVYGYIEK